MRSANLAAIYQANGMEDVSVREATRGVDSDYATASSHLFLANSYNALRDPKRIIFGTRRRGSMSCARESPLAGWRRPIVAVVSEQEYSKLFEADRFGLSSATTYFSTGEIRETASQYGIFGNFSYSLDTEYQYDNGRRPNNEITRSETYFQVKVQLTPQDTIFFQTKYQDVRQGSDPVLRSTVLRTRFPFSRAATAAILLAGLSPEGPPVSTRFSCRATRGTKYFSPISIPMRYRVVQSDGAAKRGAGKFCFGNSAGEVIGQALSLSPIAGPALSQ